MKKVIYRKRGYLVLLTLVILAGYWLLPISGRIFVMWDEQPPADAWPRFRLEPEIPRPGEEAIAILADTVPWVHIKLLVNDQQEAEFLRYEPNPLGGEWFWSFTVPEAESYELAFYHDCDQGCVEWSRNLVSNAVNVDRYPASRVPTKLGVVFANPERDWHSRSGWVVELTYTQLAKADYWSIDELAIRTQAAVAAGHRVLIRVDYDQGQSIPHDEPALQSYLETLRVMARDDRFQGIYGVVIGSSYNALASNQQASGGPVTPERYARVFNGYGTAVSDFDNVMAVIRAENPVWRVLVGPVQPWINDQDGYQSFTPDLPWLSYFNTLVASLVSAAETRAEAGWMGMTPDGFAIQALGLLDSASEDKAYTGFQVYKNWLAVINSFPPVQNLPVYITASNSYQAEIGLTPAQNYPPGWLSDALAMVNREPQIRALCWFVDDLPVDQQWQAFSLTAPQGAMVEAADEFDRLLQRGQ